MPDACTNVSYLSTNNATTKSTYFFYLQLLPADGIHVFANILHTHVVGKEISNVKY